MVSNASDADEIVKAIIERLGKLDNLLFIGCDGASVNTQCYHLEI